MGGATVVEANRETLGKEISSNDLVLVDFWAEWCAPCRVISKLLERLAIEYPKVRIVKVDAEAHKGLLAEYDVRSLPTLLLYKGGKKADQLVGKVPYVLIERAVQKAA